jgi:hypothetical protein
MDMLMRESLFVALLDRTLQFEMESAESVLKAVNGEVDIV